MSDMLRVTTPVAPKDYNSYNQGAKPQAPEQVFELGNVDYINKTNARDEQFGEQNLKDGSGADLPKMQAEISKDPALSAVLLKGLVSGSAIAVLQESGNAELLNKVTEFASEILLLPDNVTEDLVRQQDEATIFSGGLWGELKGMLDGMKDSPFSEEMNLVIMDFLKATAAAESRESVLMSISAGLRYLAGETAQSKEVVNLLLQTADRLTAENFSEVKGDVQALVNYLEQSLLLNDKTQNLLSLITYNLSRFSGSSTAVSDSFQAVLSMAPNAETADKLSMLFAEFIVDSKLPQDVKIDAMSNFTMITSAATTPTDEEIAAQANAAVRSEEADRTEAAESGVPGDTEKTAEKTAEGTAERAVGKSAEKAAEGTAERAAGKAAETASGRAASAAITLASKRSMILLTERVANAVNSSIKNIPHEKLSEIMSKTDASDGANALRDIFGQILPDNAKGGMETILKAFENDRDLNRLIDRLSVIVNKVEDMDSKITLAQGINLVLSDMAQAAGINYKPPTAMENMFDFLAKNINDPSLKSLSAMNRPEMIQGLLSAPGVFTPLLHFLVPMNMDGLRAFGELWADPDAGGAKAGEDGHHLFLCFDIENTGYFELEVYAYGKNINVSLMCPEGTEKIYQPLKSKISAIAEACGYSADKMLIEPLKRRRDLTNVFPKLKGRRSGLNVSV